jgi:hypothetical protein
MGKQLEVEAHAEVGQQIPAVAICWSAIVTHLVARLCRRPAVIGSGIP